MGMIKTRKEIELLKKSAMITDSCIKVIEDSLKDDLTEEELRKRINSKIRSQGAGLSFQTLVACGNRSAMIHPKPHASKAVISGIGYADFGASYKGYKTDITVPFIKGPIGKKERRIVDTTLRSYKLATSSIRIGDLCWKLFKKIYDFEKANGFELKHGLGHGVGKKIHEYPFLVMPKKEKLKRKKTERKKRNWKTIMKTVFRENMVFTIEPGVYVENVGGCRLENDFLITRNGPKVLTHSRLIRV
jgi:Xaa-Pro aminopeptidase